MYYNYYIYIIIINIIMELIIMIKDINNTHINKWHYRYMELAEVIASFSKDPSTKVGAIIIDNYNRPVSLGFNGMAKGFKDTDKRLLDREFKLRHTIHAEQNAILNSGRDLHSLECTIYCTHFPCTICMSSIKQAGIRKVVCWEPDKEFMDRWGTDESVQIARECGIIICMLKKE